MSAIIDGMKRPQFSIRRLLVTVFCFATALGFARFLNAPIGLQSRLAIAIGVGALLGAGFGSPFNKALDGSLVGAVMGAAVFLLFPLFVPRY